MAATFAPGDLVRGFAARHNWPVAERTIVVEGEHESRYFALANRLNLAKTGLHLITPKLSAFPTGIGDDGGAFGMQKHFHPLRAIMDADLTADGRKVFHAIALFDNDNVGRRGFAGLSGQHLNYRKWRDVFLLQRVLPRSTRDPQQMEKLTDEANRAWKGMDCEIEDLISMDLIDEFVSQSSDALARNHAVQQDGFHCYMKPHAKAGLVRFAEANAIFEDMERVVELLKSLRFHLALPPDGEVNA